MRYRDSLVAQEGVRSRASISEPARDHEPGTGQHHDRDGACGLWDEPAHDYSLRSAGGRIYNFAVLLLLVGEKGSLGTCAVGCRAARNGKIDGARTRAPLPVIVGDGFRSPELAADHYVIGANGSEWLTANNASSSLVETPTLSNILLR